ncbi:MAG: PAS domain S-box protein [bacterium]|nr:PAS domain S-box protein [bacterium]
MKSLALRTVLPALLAIILFSGVVFLYLLPSLDRVVMDQKRLMIRELTESAWNVMARFAAEEEAGGLTRRQAQAQAVAQVRNLHYGQQSKDYFFVIDLVPRMVVHPYRPDLEGQDLNSFGDPEGKRLFVEMVRVVQRDGAGYVDYMWQWKDDSTRIVPKLSYVKGFQPWGWIIGTGVYTEDVDAEIAALKSNLQTAVLVILAVVALLMVVLLRASFQAERGRLRAAAALRGSEEKYRSLVESAGEAILMSMAGEGLYANRSMLHLLGYERDEFAGLDPADLIRPTDEETDRGRRFWQDVTDGIEPPSRYEVELVHKDGDTMRVTLTLSRIVVQGRTGFMAVAARLSQPRELNIHSAENLDDLEAVSRRTRDLAALMMKQGADAVETSRMLSANADGVVRKAVEFIVAELGPPPARFDFMLMGSLGRSEVTLLADQDHALIFEDVPDEDFEYVQQYFLRMGARLSDLLAGSGYAYCKGRIMASEPDCCLSLSGWRATFDRWLTGLEPDDLLRAKFFFDFRGELDEGTLVPALQEHLTTAVQRHPRFLPLLAHSVLAYEPPLNTFGRFVLEDGEDGRSVLDIKGVQAQLVDLTRLRALQHGVTVTSTLDRLRELGRAGHIKDKTSSEARLAFRTLLNLRLRHQSRRRTAKLTVDNLLAPVDLDDVEREALKSAFVQIKALQDGLQLDFGAPS